MLAHELRNPLAAITQRRHARPSVAAWRRDLDWSQEVIERQIKNLARLIDDLLDVSRITQGKIELRKRRSSTSPAVIDQAVEAVRPLIERAEARADALSSPAGRPAASTPTRRGWSRSS